jgi:UDP-2,4-diacetamido-2,4,6-trideoxy-beta-L-altropyranose hydrolase
MPLRLTDPVAPTGEGASRWLFRIASSPGVGGGHIARCTSLGLELLRHCPVTMMLDPDGLQWRPHLEEMGFDVCTSADRPAGLWSGSLVDGYDFDRDYLVAIRRIAAPLVFMLDQGSAPIEADLIVSPAVPVGDKKLAQGRRLSGLDFALLDPSFRDRPQSVTKTVVGKIFVICGMRDSANATGLILAALQCLAKREFRPAIDVAISSSAPHLSALERTLAGQDANVSIHQDAKDIAELLSAADLVIGAGGVSLLERMACGVPSITLSVAENQVAGAQMAHDIGATLYVGSINDLTVQSLADHVWDIANDVEGRKRQSGAARDAVDGRGAERVAKVMMAMSAEFRSSPSMSGLAGRN